jgi:flagellar motor switch protein FliG
MAGKAGTPLARIATGSAPALAAAQQPARRALSPREKAAVIVRLLLAEGTSLPLSSLPEHMQAALAEQMGQMRLVDRTTLGAIVEEFMSELEDVGLAFPGGIEGALGMMDGHISSTAANRLRRLAGASSKADPWDRLTNLPTERLMPVIEAESTEVAAVMLSKLPVPKAADLLGRLPGERARRVAYAVSMTGNVDPETVRRIGASLVAQLDAIPPRAFETGPVERVGAILNVSPAQTREEVLKGLAETDSDFAEQVRRALFTFVHIPERLEPRDVPKVLRLLDQPVTITALAWSLRQAELAPVAEFMLANISQRLAESLRDEVAARGRVKEREGDEATNAVVMAIRQLQGAGEIMLRQDED